MKSFPCYLETKIILRQNLRITQTNTPNSICPHRWYRLSSLNYLLEGFYLDRWSVSYSVYWSELMIGSELHFQVSVNKKYNTNGFVNDVTNLKSSQGILWILDTSVTQSSRIRCFYLTYSNERKPWVRPSLPLGPWLTKSHLISWSVRLHIEVYSFR